ncbi:MAG: hypothetical protein ETSY2_27860 [Candidatus Entotheonella gemina]|uniref:Uncharacterized protein n=1 Tax=Candidatus Entotheonella gemina TaxID=1429439 RepID=W4M2N2_9BACT|nr:MAG: hypothetical protein ETSY2_27860 [Candidatus Entotheonella gemina]
MSLPTKTDWSKVDPSKLNLRSVYRNLSPEERATYKRIAELADQDKEWASMEADQIMAKRMKAGLNCRAAVAALRRECKRKGISNDEMMARSGLDAAGLASMAGRDAMPSIEIMEAYALSPGQKPAHCLGRR